MSAATPTTVTIEPWTDDDLELLHLVNAPEMMYHLGGPESPAAIAARHERYLAGWHTATAWMFRVVLAGGEPAGTVGYWQRDWRAEPVYEMGWSTLPPYQGHGVAAAATQQALCHARSTGQRRYVHAFPSVTHAASNGVCRRAGFDLVGECEFEYPPGHHLRSNEWRVDLWAAEPLSPPTCP